MAYISGAVGTNWKAYKVPRGSPSRDGNRYLFRGRVYRRLYKLPQYTGEGEECLCCTLEDGCCGAVASLLCVVYLLVLIFSVQKTTPVKKPLQSQPESPETDFGTPVYVSRSLLDHIHPRRGRPQNIPARPSCQSKENFVFIRHNQTASPILTNILQRFGDARDSIFATPECDQNRTNCCSRFRAISNTSFNIISDSIRFRKDLLHFMPVNTIYFTMLRNPGKKLAHQTCAHPLVSETQQRNHCEHQNHISNEMSHNLGLNDSESLSSVASSFPRLEAQLDFVLIEEYFEESLLLLRKEMCWTFNDILYFIPRIKFYENHRHYFTKNCFVDQTAKNRTLDSMLYGYFNRSFWRRLRHYGGDLERDLLILRYYVQLVSDACSTKLLQEMTELSYNVSTIITEPSLEYCQNLVKSNEQYSRDLARKREQSMSWKRKRKLKNRVQENIKL